MSSMNLNLLPSKAKFQAVKIKLQSRIRLVMAIIIGVWITVTAGVLAANLVATLKIKQVKAAAEKVQANYLAMQESIVTSQRFKYKTKMVGEVLNNRFEYGRAFELVTSMFGGGIVIDSYDLGKDRTFTIKGQTQGKSNVDELEKIVTQINQGENEKISRAKLTNLVLAAGVWKFAMEVGLK